jgi:hypothetical protein
MNRFAAAVHSMIVALALLLPRLLHRIAKLAEGSPATAYKPSTSLIP